MPARKIYVASSWRNDIQQSVVAALREAGNEVYDFRNPESGTGFHWTEVGLQRNNDVASVDSYLTALAHPRSEAGFTSDFDAMKWADTFVLVLPCGRSAHLELGWAVGAGKRTAILLDDPCTPELMYRMVDLLSADLAEIVDWVAKPIDPAKGIEVTACDRETGEVMKQVILPGDYVVVAAFPAAVTYTQVFPKSGTHQLTIKKDARR